MEEIKQQIEQQFNQVFKQVSGVDIQVALEIPKSLEHGDFTTNAALVAAKQAGKPPRQLAEEVVKEFRVQNSKFKIIEKMEVAGSGFINIWLSDQVLLDSLQSSLNEKLSLVTQDLEMIENTGPNTNKPLHIGHLRNIAIGEAIVHLRQATGHNAVSVNINNDRGIHIVKAMLGYLIYGSKTEKAIKQDWQVMIARWFESRDEWKLPDAKPDHFVGRFYVLGEKLDKEDNEYFKAQSSAMLKAWEEGDMKVRSLWAQMNGWFYEGFTETHARFVGISPREKQYYKQWYESQLYEAGKQLVLDNLDKGLFYKREDGAILAKLENFNLPDKVVIRSDGTSVYITQDLALAKERIEEDNAQFIGYVVSSEQDLHFKQLFAICEGLGIGSQKQFRHIFYGMVTLAGGVKMSSREGNVVSADELMDIVRNRIKTLYPETKDQTLERIAIGAIKFWMLKYTSNTPIAFNIEQSVDLQGESGPYLQYTYARTQSVINKANSKGQIAKIQIKNKKLSSFPHSEPSGEDSSIQEIKRSFANAQDDEVENYQFNSEEMMLLRKISQYEMVIFSASEKFAPNVLADYLFELAKLFNNFYQKYQIITKNNTEKSMRIMLTIGVGKRIKDGLTLLGIPTPERM